MRQPRSYPYAHLAVLDRPNTYRYTPFEGLTFLETWHTCRKAVQNQLGGQMMSPPEPVTAFDLIRDDASDAWAHFDGLYAGLRNSGPEHPAVERRLEQWVRKFEVTKRVYTSYDVQFKPVEGANCDYLPVYLRLGEVLDRAYEAAGVTPVLNTLLKLVDTLCGRALDLVGTPEAGRLVWLIDREQTHVAAMARQLGVEGGA